MFISRYFLDDSQSTGTWSGCSMEEIYQNKSPWDYNVPAVNPSRFHGVLFNVESLTEIVPTPRVSENLQHWGVDFVKLPYSPQNLFPIKTVSVIQFSLFLCILFYVAFRNVEKKLQQNDGLLLKKL